MFAPWTLWHNAITDIALHVVAPALSWLHLTGMTDSPREIATALMISAMEVLIIALLFRPLESLIPAEQWTHRRYARIDRFYTLLKYFGVLPIFTYLMLQPFTYEVGQWFGSTGSSSGDSQDSLITLQQLIPWLHGHSVIQFLIYFALFDLVYYLIHRLQHAVPWWWALHSLHHSQRQLNCWSNDRDHYLDDLFEVLIISLVSLLIGVQPVDYALLILTGDLVQIFSHANVRIRFGKVLDKVLVDPRYHRLHHMRVDPERPHLHDCNFALVFPIWDILFRTALYNEPLHPCGVDAAEIDADNDKGFLGQQGAGLARFWRALPRMRPRQGGAQVVADNQAGDRA
ncbi:sterol desaturase family protein [Oleiagrimonas sp. C23AA]|uniref:sterol desaturase family protein n=1 Tax=Oleiagrimonas sp. C23AA TaxID=2719047 RepID=UPI0014239720|nr:sterol desaturase family protein [Oleiagrimonas sp. C23AA]NII09124.1 sterol desaturase family protein [Oleiagrimonas sp. C23AA]